MQRISLVKNEEVIILQSNPNRKTFSIRVLGFGETVTVNLGQDIGIPGNQGLYQIESTSPWTGFITAVCASDLDIEIDESV